MVLLFCLYRQLWQSTVCILSVQTTMTEYSVCSVCTDNYDRVQCVFCLYRQLWQSAVCILSVQTTMTEYSMYSVCTVCILFVQITMTEYSVYSVCTDNYDRVQCVFCRGSLHHWERDDNPMTEHARSFNFCRFVKGLECGNREYKSDVLTAEELKNINFYGDPPGVVITFFCKDYLECVLKVRNAIYPNY